MVVYGVKRGESMFDRIEYIVNQIDGDYVYLRNLNSAEQEDKCVARALLPVEINEGTRVIYELMEYSILE